ncbi:unnamed protein product [Rangifer tarandus platyrhynchus]|uniref:Uncharacterized protein n=1 Tax=Rangifer tarandus platyrhynchus TaxID=3082113 RepID=A0AC59ZQC8_RANTA
MGSGRHVFKLKSCLSGRHCPILQKDASQAVHAPPALRHSPDPQPHRALVSDEALTSLPECVAGECPAWPAVEGHVWAVQWVTATACRRIVPPSVGFRLNPHPAGGSPGTFSDHPPAGRSLRTLRPAPPSRAFLSPKRSPLASLAPTSPPRAPPARPPQATAGELLFPGGRKEVSAPRRLRAPRQPLFSPRALASRGPGRQRFVPAGHPHLLGLPLLGSGSLAPCPTSSPLGAQDEAPGMA